MEQERKDSKMSELFDFKTGEKHHDDVYTVMGRAIRQYFNNDETKITSGMARAMAQIIDCGFLESVISEQKELVDYEKRRLEDEKKKVSDYQKSTREIIDHYNHQKNESVRLDKVIREMRSQIDEYQKIIEEEADKCDAELMNAKRAYMWIFAKTQDKTASSKAFNCYLLGKSGREIKETKLRLVQRLTDGLRTDIVRSLLEDEEDIDLELE